MTEWAWVICNGPSSLEWQGYPMGSVVIGCNMAFRDWPVSDLVAIDRMTVHEIRVELKDTYTFTPWTRTSGLALPPGWSAEQPPGIDSGSLAVKIGLQKAQKVIVIGADGVLRGDVTTRYQYRWHPKGPPKHIHQRHRRAMLELHRHSADRIYFHSEQPDPELLTLTQEEITATVK